MRRFLITLAAALAGLPLSLAAWTGSATAAPLPAWGGCPADYSCYYEGVAGEGRVWTAPSCGRHGLPFTVRSVWNRGHGTIYWYIGGSYSGWNTPVGSKSSNGALAADAVDIAC